MEILFESSRLARLSGINESSPQDTALDELIEADGRAWRAAALVIDKLLDSVEKVMRYDLTGGLSSERWEVTDEWKDAITTAAEARDLPLAGLLSYAEYETTGGETSAFVTIANFKDSKSQPGQGDKDALMYSNLMAAATEMGELADKWGSKVSAWAVGTEAQHLKDAAYKAHAALIRLTADTDTGSVEDLRTSDY